MKTYKVCLKSLTNPIRKQTKQKIQINFLYYSSKQSPSLQLTFDNVCTSLGNDQQRPPVESIAERLSHDLRWLSCLQKSIFDDHLKKGKQEEIQRSHIREVRRVTKHSYHLLSQEHYRGAASILVLWKSDQTCQICCSNVFKTTW